MQPKYKDYKVISGYDNYTEFKNKINYFLARDYTLVGGISISFSPEGTRYFAQAVAKIKEQPCQNQLTLS